MQSDHTTIQYNTELVSRLLLSHHTTGNNSYNTDSVLFTRPLREQPKEQPPHGLLYLGTGEVISRGVSGDHPEFEEDVALPGHF